MVETWLNEKDNYWKAASSLSITPMQLHCVDRISENRGGGIDLVSNDKYKIEKESEIKSKFFKNAIWTLSSGNTKLTIVGIYHPPTTGKLKHLNTDFIDEFAEFFTTISSIFTNYVILGDFNIDYWNYSDIDVQQFQDMCDTLGLIQHVTFTTHFSDHTLDLVFTNINSKVNIINVQCNTAFSDHNSIHLEIGFKKSIVSSEKVLYRNWKKLDPKTFNEKLQALDDLLPYDCNNLSEFLNSFDHSITNILDDILPLRHKKQIKRDNQPWYNEDLRDKKRHVQRREFIWRKYRQEHQREAFKIARSKYFTALHESRSKFYSTQFIEHKHDSKFLYNLVAKLTGNIAQNPLPDKPDKILCEEFAEFFLEKITNIRDIPSFVCPESDIILNLNHLPCQTEETIRKVIFDLKPKSCEIDLMPNNVLKAHLPLLLKPITNIVNLSFLTSTFAMAWKTAILHPLLKKSNLPLIYKNYRPVSNLSFISKITEKAAMGILDEHCSINMLNSDYQSAYKKGFSCETLLLKIVNDILWTMENKQITALVMLGLSAAF